MSRACHLAGEMAALAPVALAGAADFAAGAVVRARVCAFDFFSGSGSGSGSLFFSTFSAGRLLGVDPGGLELARPGHGAGYRDRQLGGRLGRGGGRRGSG